MLYFHFKFSLSLLNEYLRLRRRRETEYSDIEEKVALEEFEIKNIKKNDGFDENFKANVDFKKKN